MKKKSLKEGKIDKNKAGFAFLIRDDGVKPDIYISRKNQMTAMDNDIVKVEITSGIKSPKPEGRVVKIISRASDESVGTFFKKRGVTGFIPLGSSDKINLLKNNFLDKASDGDRVKVKIERMPTEHKRALGRITKILGKGGNYDTELAVTLIHSNITSRFKKSAVKEAEELSNLYKPAADKKREDLRDLLTFTIDPDDSKDFDDALSIRRIKEHFELGVHIADVSHFVKEGSNIDREAFSRGTSVYLPGKVIPMLPEPLSNGICSLKPDEDRFALSVIIKIKKDGNIINSRFTRTLIKSNRRFTYDEIDKILEGGEAQDKNLLKAIRDMEILAKALNKKREKRGAIDFDFPDRRIILKPDGSVDSIIKEERTFSHRIVEEFMLLANETVATYTSEHKIPSLYRVHEKPDAEKMESFRNFVQTFGFTIPRDDKVTPRHLQTILAKIVRTKEEVLISTMMLRSLQQAVYSPVNAGHFALAAKSYTHFTSPIRRYPDLIVHRVLTHIILDGKLNNDSKEKYNEKLKDWAKDLSTKERAADSAQMQAEELKIMEYMKNRTGEKFNAIISGVTSFGIFVEVKEGLEGLIHISELKDDYYTYDESDLSLKGRRKNRVFRIGESIKVKLVRVDLEARQVDFLPA